MLAEQWLIRSTFCYDPKRNFLWKRNKTMRLNSLIHSLLWLGEINLVLARSTREESSIRVPLHHDLYWFQCFEGYSSKRRRRRLTINHLHPVHSTPTTTATKQMNNCALNQMHKLCKQTNRSSAGHTHANQTHTQSSWWASHQANKQTHLIPISQLLNDIVELCHHGAAECILAPWTVNAHSGYAAYVVQWQHQLAITILIGLAQQGPYFVQWKLGLFGLTWSTIAGGAAGGYCVSVRLCTSIALRAILVAIQQRCLAGASIQQIQRAIRCGGHFGVCLVVSESENRNGVVIGNRTCSGRKGWGNGVHSQHFDGCFQCGWRGWERRRRRCKLTQMVPSKLSNGIHYIRTRMEGRNGLSDGQEKVQAR